MMQRYLKSLSIIALIFLFVFQVDAAKNETPDIAKLMEKLQKSKPHYEVFVFRQISELGVHQGFALVSSGYNRGSKFLRFIG